VRRGRKWTDWWGLVWERRIGAWTGLGKKRRWAHPKKGRWAGEGALLTVPDLIKSNFQIAPYLNQPKGGLSKLKKFQIKYGFVGNQIRNNFPYWNFSKYRIEFKLKNMKALGFEIQI
jgi:hypothetical protein